MRSVRKQSCRPHIGHHGDNKTAFCFRQQKAGGASGVSRAKAAPLQDHDEVHEGAKSKAMPARYIRGPPINKPLSEQVRPQTP